VGVVQTVTGPIDGAELGLTRMHEHLLIDVEWIQGRFTYDVLDDEQLAIEELLPFREAGGRSMVDLTVPDSKRDPEAIARISEATGVQVVMGCGWYREPYYPPEIDRMSVRALAAVLRDEIEEGVGPGHIRPGIVGEIGSNKGFLSAKEERVFRAAARAAKESGLALNTHSVGDRVGLEHLAVLAEEGLDLGRAIVGHADTYLYLDYQLEIVRRGAVVSFDQIGMYPHSTWWMEKVAWLIDELWAAGFGDRIVLSTDICKKAHLRAFKGPGYVYLLDTYIPFLRERGVTQAQLDQMLVHTPRRMLERLGT
jgi:phosphotriesterase-related protein